MSQKLKTKAWKLYIWTCWALKSTVNNRTLMDKFITSHVWAVRAYCPVRELHLPFSEAISQAGFHWFTLHWMSSAFLKWWCFKEVWLMSGLNIKLCYSCSKKILWKKRFFFRQENSFQFRQSWKAKELFFFPTLEKLLKSYAIPIQVLLSPLAERCWCCELHVQQQQRCAILAVQDKSCKHSLWEADCIHTLSVLQS